VLHIYDTSHLRVKQSVFLSRTMVSKWSAVMKYASIGRGVCQWFSTWGSRYQKDKETVVSAIYT